MEGLGEEGDREGGRREGGMEGEGGKHRQTDRTNCNKYAQNSVAITRLKTF